MDTGNGTFKMMNPQDPERVSDFYKQLEVAKKEYPNHGGTFYVGQNLELNGSKFRVLAITKKTMTLRLLPK